MHAFGESEFGLAATSNVGIDDVWGTGRAPFSRLLIDPLNLKRASHYLRLTHSLYLGSFIFSPCPLLNALSLFRLREQKARLFICMPSCQHPSSACTRNVAGTKTLFAPLCVTLIRPVFHSLPFCARCGCFDWGKKWIERVTRTIYAQFACQLAGEMEMCGDFKGTGKWKYYSFCLFRMRWINLHLWLNSVRTHNLQ